ncbi:uncharacterized protein FOMMEDRAFT_131524 [Fomitiporia mediterranea MF3/22]|uniref:uncharacterized protein n=1 Tax=Fomitiporia mediterranea (strain MF3/22) TaxID=694068 RepID=UPI00044095C9|nr:uncharacterized protein FOMMEDRAFT_131524 [Fomitiporia mediterranea MF3/22]EJD06639.1 hypothetical protein FOMMEDRAFT_131524 [Fomitiporia mediterranea MF3/22]
MPGEVINVDDLAYPTGRTVDDDDVQLISHAPARRSQEPIVIEDSDDDVEIVAGPSHPQPHNARSERPEPIRRRVLFSPSPPPQDLNIPPVPPLPPNIRFARPARWRGPPDFAGVIRPFDQPFAFEEGLRAPPRLPPIRNLPQQVEPVAGGANAARRPNMGLGGALFAYNRRNRFEPAYPPAPPARAEENVAGWRNIFSNFGVGAYRMLFQRAADTPDPPDDFGNEEAAILAALAYEAEDLYPRARSRQFRPVPRPAPARANKEEPSYKSEFTHPTKPESGFSNDFSSQETITITDGPGPSSVSASETIVCAHCLDPLVINVMGSEEQVRKRKLFALRCGHMFDGKCINALMKPQPVPVPDVGQGTEADDSATDKGKRKETGTWDGGSEWSQLGTGSNGWPPKHNTKGKQRAADPDVETSHALTVPTKRKGTPLESSSSTSTTYTRSRLRPRTGGSNALAAGPAVASPLHIVSSANDMAEGSQSVPDASESNTRGRSRRGRRRGGASGKGKGRGKGKGKAAAAPVIEAEYLWTCPVQGCGREHKSVLIAGEWRMDEERGAVALYV